MKKFEFSLQKVLDVRETEEKILQKNLLLIQNDILETEREQNNITSRIAQENTKHEKNLRKETNSAKIMLHHNYVSTLQDKLEDIRDRIEKLLEDESRAKHELLEKVREKKTIEKLREMKFDEYKTLEKKEEQAFLDELNTQKKKDSKFESH